MDIDVTDKELASLDVEAKRQALEIAWLAQCVRDLRGEIAEMQGRIRDRKAQGVVAG